MKKVILIILSISIALAVYLTWKALAPANSLQNLEEFASTYSDVKTDSLLNHPDLKDASRSRAYKQSLLSLKKDSIHLIVDLKDSMVGLYINGVTIHRVKTESFSLDPVLSNLSNSAYLSLFGSTITNSADTATIVKEPIVIREAPKDTIEAALNAFKPDTLIQNPAFWLIELPGEIDLIFSQKTDNTPLDVEVRDKFDQYISERNDRETFSRFIRLKKAESAVRIIIPLPVEDLRAIYRALPKNGKLLIRY